jgi:hypothetical protein
MSWSVPIKNPISGAPHRFQDAAGGSYGGSEVRTIIAAGLVVRITGPGLNKSAGAVKASLMRRFRSSRPIYPFSPPIVLHAAKDE